jgi:hypothetical protein
MLRVKRNLWYDRPADWFAMISAAFANTWPAFDSHRPAGQYYTDLYN